MPFANHFEIERFTARPRPRFEIDQQGGHRLRHVFEKEFGALARPAKRLLFGVAFDGKPALAKQNSGIDGGDIAGARQGASVRRDAERTLAGVEADQVGAAVGQLLFDGSVHRDAAHGVVTVDAVHASGLEPLFRDESSQLAGEQNIDVGGQHEAAASPANAGILGDHLVQRQRFGVRIPAVQLGRNFDESDFARA